MASRDPTPKTATGVTGGPRSPRVEGWPSPRRPIFDALVVGSDRLGRPSDGGLDARETQILADVLSPFTDTPDEAYFCLLPPCFRRRSSGDVPACGGPQTWLVATEIDGYLTYVGAAQAAIDTVLAHTALDAVPVRPETPLDPSHG